MLLFWEEKLFQRNVWSTEMFSFYLHLSISISVSQNADPDDKASHLDERPCMIPSPSDLRCDSSIWNETSSAKSDKGHLLKQPKKGFLCRINLVVNRMFMSKI